MVRRPVHTPATVKLALDITYAGDVAVARCRGPLTREDEYEFRSRLRTLLPGYSKLVLDCSNLDRVDSGGLGALIAIFVSFRSFSGDIRLAAVPKSVRQVMEICSMGNVLRTFPSVQEAVSSYHPTARGA